MVAACLAAHRSGAQATTDPLVDGSVLPRGLLGVRVATSWSRFDELLGDVPGGRSRNLAWSLDADSLTTSLLPLLAPVEAAIRTLSGTPAFRLTAGNLVAAANSRVLTAPLILEYGLTRRLTLGVVVPLVETRSTVFAQLNPKLGAANVGPNPGLVNQTLRAAEASLISSFRAAAAALAQRLTQCQASPGDTGCATLLSQQSAAQALVQSTGVTANAIEALYGGDATHPGQAFVPLAGTPVETAIEARIAGLIAQYQAVLPSAVITGAVAGAGGPGARLEMQALLAAAGRDSLHPVDRSSIGDISAGATFQLFDTFGDTLARRRVRAAVHAAYRIGTGEPASRNTLFDVGTGYGQPGIEVGAAADALFGTRWSLTTIAEYTANLGTVAVARVPSAANAILPLTTPVPGTYSAGNVARVTIIPRWRVAGDFTLDARYALTNIGADAYGPVTLVAGQLGNAAATTQALGFGFSYSTLGIGRPMRKALPSEMSFSHLETLAGSGGPAPKTFRDQITLRVFVGR